VKIEEMIKTLDIHASEHAVREFIDMYFESGPHSEEGKNAFLMWIDAEGHEEVKNDALYRNFCEIMEPPTRQEQMGAEPAEEHEMVEEGVY
jgi:hypothetical protein